MGAGAPGLGGSLGIGCMEVWEYLRGMEVPDNVRGKSTRAGVPGEQDGSRMG